MNKVFISKNYRDPYTASSKAKMDAEKIANKIGYRNIGLPARSIKNKIIGNIYTVFSNLLAYLRMPRNSIILLQYPVKLLDRQLLCAKRRNNRTIILIHDLDCLRGGRDLNTNILNEADFLIAHTPVMKTWLLEHNLGGHIEILEVFDYLTYAKEIGSKYVESAKYTVGFAGNLGKSKFLNKLSYESILLELFGVGAEKISLHKGLIYKGCYPSEDLYKHLDTHFGLVWDGDEIVTCSGNNGEYLKVNCPHKLSLYLSLGIPVIVWKDSAMAPFVESNNVGFSVGSLSEIELILNEMKYDDYKKLVDNACRIGSKLRDGYYLVKAIKSIEIQLWK